MSVCQSHKIPTCYVSHMGELQPNFCEKEETITIKKELWDEMLECNKRIDLHTETFTALLERIQNLEQHKNYQIDENRKVDRRIEELEEMVKYMDKFKFS